MRKKEDLVKKRKELAAERIDILFTAARQNFAETPELSHRYVELARKISMKYKVKLASEYKRQFCKHCYRYLMPGVNSRVRTKSGKLVYYCYGCRNYSRIPIKKKKN